MNNTEKVQARIEAFEKETGLVLSRELTKALPIGHVGQWHNRLSLPKGVCDYDVLAYRAADSRDRQLNPVSVERYSEKLRRTVTFLEVNWNGEVVLPANDEWEE